MERDTHYFMVGLFVIATAVAGFLFGGLFYDKPYLATDLYDIHFDTPVEGLAKGSEVRYMGIKVGEVTRVFLMPADPARVGVRVMVEAGTPVNAATTATLRQQGLTGVPFISLAQDAATKPAPIARVKGEEFPIIPTKPIDMDVLLQRLPDVEKKLAVLLESANKVLDDNNRENFAGLLKNLNTAAAGIPELLKNLNKTAAGVPELVKNLNQTSRDIGVLSRHADGVVGRTEKDLSATLKQFQQTAQQLGKLAQDIDRVVVNNEGRVNELLGEGGENLKQLLAESRKTAASLRQLGDKLKENPSQIIYQPAPQGTELPR